MTSSKQSAASAAKQILIALLSCGSLKTRDIKEYPGNHYTNISRLSKRGLIDLKEVGGITTVFLSKEGRTKALQYSLADLKLKPQKSWDKKWRIVIFDIPNKHKIARNVLREKLKELGFRQYQESVLIFPYDCRNEIEFIKTIYGIRPFVKYLTAENIEDEAIFKRVFHLK